MNTAEKPAPICTILVLEGDPVVRDLITLALGRVRTLGPSSACEVFATADGSEALKFLKEKRPALILLDILLPRINGLDWLKQVKKQGLIKNTPVIVLSSLGYREVVEQALLAGAADFVIKPFHADELVRRVEHTLRKQRGLSDTNQDS